MLQTEHPKTEKKPVSRKYDTPTMNELLLRIFGEEQRGLIHATLTGLDEEYSQEAGSAAAEPAHVTAAPTAARTRSSADPFEAIGAELRREERLDFLEAFER